jgi:multidrug efflux pump subunit AcrB
VNTRARHPQTLLTAAACAAGVLLFALALYVLRRPSLPEDALPPEDDTPAAGAPEAPDQRRGPGADRSAGVVVVAGFPGMPAPVVERTITSRLERWLGQAAGALHTESRSAAGVAVVRVSFRAGVSPAEAYAGAAAVAQRTLAALPAGTRPPAVWPWDPARIFPLGAVVVEGAGLNEAKLEDAARDAVLPAVAAVPGVLVPGVLGGKDRVVLVSLDSARLEARGLTDADVARALRQKKLAFSTGPPSPAGPVLVLDDPRAAPPDELGALPLQPGPPAVFLRDVGRVEQAEREPGTRVRLDGRRGVCLPVFGQGADDPAPARQAVRQALAGLRDKLPRGAAVSFRPEAAAVALFARAPSGTAPDAAERRLGDIEAVVAEVVVPARRVLVLSVLGVGADWSAAATPNSGPQDAMVRVFLAEGQQARAPDTVRRLQHRLATDARFADLHFFFEGADPLGGPFLDGVSADLILRLTAPSLEQGLEAAREVRRLLEPVRGAADLHVAERLDAPYLAVEVDRQKAADAGLPAGDVLSQASAALGKGPGQTSEFWLDAPAGRPQGLAVSAADLPGAKLEALLDVPAAGARVADRVTLGRLVQVRRTTAAVEVHHADGARVFHVRVNVEGRDRQGVRADVERALRGLRLPPGVRLEVLTGQGP